jgi:Ca2+-binding EF-hand superfamily protein
MRIALSLIFSCALLACASSVAADEKDDLRKALGGDPKEVLRSILKRYDTNGDGVIDGRERALAGEQMKREFAAGKLPDEMKALADRDGDGVISPQEMAGLREMLIRMQGGAGGAPGFGGDGFGGGAFGGLGGGGFGGGGFGGGGFGGAGGGEMPGWLSGGPIPAEVLKKFDKNKDGMLDDKEMKAAAAALAPKKSRAQLLKEKLDLNGDGKVSKEEREAAAEQRKAELEEKKKEREKKKDDE